VKRLSTNEIDEAIEESIMPLPKPLSNEQLQKLRDASKANGGRQLTDDEREIVLYGKVQTKIVSGIPILK